MGASCSTGEGTRLESTASLERRFEGAGCNGRALGSVPLSHVPESARFRRSFVVLLDFWGSTEGPTLRFSRWRGVIHRIYDRRGTSRLLGSGLAGAKMATSGRFLLMSSRLEAWVGACVDEGALGSKS